MDRIIGTWLRQLRWDFWRPSKQRYLWLCAIRLLKRWWNTTWIYLGFVAVLSGFLSEKVTGEPTVILLCIAMVLAVRDVGTIRANKVTSVLVLVLGVAAAFLSLPKEAEVGALNPQLWTVVGIIIGVSALTVFFFVLCVPLGRGSGRRKGRRPSIKRGLG